MLELYTMFAVPICLASMLPTVIWFVWIIAPIILSYRCKNL